MTPSTKFLGLVGLRKARIGRTWIPVTGVGLCSLVGMLLLSDVGWAAPKQTYTSCKCTCRWVDELGKEHYGPPGAVLFTESSLSACLGHYCTATTPTGTHKGTTRDCMGTEHQSQMTLPPGGVQGQLQPATPGKAPVPVAPGTIMRRGVEDDQSTSSEKEGK
jgi:hypothetical protein